MQNIFENNPVALATITKFGTPNIIGVTGVKIVDNQVIITDNYMRQTKEDIENNENVCLISWDKNLNGYKVIGKAKHYSGGKWLKFVKALPENKDYPAKGAVVAKIDKIIKLK